MRNLLLSLLLCLMANNLYPQSAQSDLLFAQGVELYNQGKYKEAIPFFTESDKLDKAELDSTSNRRDYSATWLASCHAKLGNEALAREIDESGDWHFPVDRRKTVESDALSEIGLSLYFAENFSKSLEYFQRCASLEKEIVGERHPFYAETLKACYQCSYNIGDSIQALRYLKECHDIIGQSYGTESLKYAELSLELGLLYSSFYYEDWETLSSKYLQNAYRIYAKEKSFNDSVMMTELMNRLSNLADIMASSQDHIKLLKAIELEEQSQEIRRALYGEGNKEYAYSLFQLYSFHYSLEHEELALEYISKAVKICEKYCQDDKHFYVQCLNQLASVYSLLGKKKEAYKTTVRAYEISRELKGADRMESALSLYNLALSQLAVGKFYEPGMLLSEAVKIVIENKDDVRAGSMLVQGLELMGYVFLEAGVTHLADSLAHLGITLAQGDNALNETDRIVLYTSSLKILSDCSVKLGDYSQAIEYERKALNLYETAQFNYALPLSYYRLGAIYSYSKEYKMALQNLLKAKKYLEEQEVDKNQYLSLLDALSSCYYELNMEREASEYVITANKGMCDFILKSFLKLNSSSERSAFWDKYHYIFENILRIAYRFGDEEVRRQAFNSMLFSKGLLLNCDIALNTMQRKKGINLEEKNQIREQKMEVFDDYIENYKWKKDYNEGMVDFVINQINPTSLTDDEEKIFVNNMMTSWVSVKEKLWEKDVAIEFFSFYLAKDSLMYAALVLQKDMTSPKLVPLFEEKQLKKDKGLYARTNIGKLVWAPLAEYIGDKENIYFAPTGELYNIAIESVPHWEGDCLMSDKWNMYRLSSTRELAIIKNKAAMKKASVYGGVKYDTKEEYMIANSKKFSNQSRSMDEVVPFELTDSLDLRSGVSYLPATKIEAEEIGRTLKGKNMSTTLRIDTLATESDLKNLGGKNTNLLHIATHGFYWTEREANLRDNLDFLMLNARHPRYVEDKALTRSGLLMAGANNALMGKKLPEGVDDGILTAKEISQLDLRGMDLVVLSACQTGLGEIKGDGVFGLQRGFKKAGANSILMSLWKVDDEATRLLMTQFYKNLTSGMNKHESLKQAQKYVRDYEEDVEVKFDVRKTVSAQAKEQVRQEAMKEKTYKRVKKYQDPYYWAAFILLDAVD